MSKFKKVYDVPFPMNLDDALNNYDSNTYEVDSTGDWEETETIKEFREEASDSMLHFPATVDNNHLVFYNEDEDHVEVMNMIPKQHLDSLHNNPSKKTKWIKRANFVKVSSRLKVPRNVDVEEFFRDIIRNKKHDLKCSQIIDMFYDILREKGLSNDGITFVVNDRGHLFFKDSLTSQTYTQSCHYKNKQGSFNPSEIGGFFGVLKNSILFRENIAKTASVQKWVKVAEIEKEADLRDWFKKEKWVDVSRPKKDGKGYEPCGRGDTSKGKKPVCTPANKAKNLTEKERKNRIRQKRQKEKEPNPDKKPNVTKYSPGAGGKSNIS